MTLRVVALVAAAATGWGAGAEESGAVRLATLGGTQTAAAAQPLDPAAEALRAALQAQGDAGVSRYYASRAFAPIWFGTDGGEAARALLEALERADEHALPPSRYGVAALRADLARAEAASGAGRLAAEARAEAALSHALVRFGGDLNAGVLEPRKVDREIHVFPERPSPDALLAGAARAPDMAAYLRGLAPANPEYDRLRGLYREYRDLVEDGGWQAGDLSGEALRLGDRDPRVAALRTRLAELGDLPRLSVPEPMLFDARLEEAVRAFQRRHGLNDDGVPGRRTFDALNADARLRMQQIAVNLERLRWLNRDLGRRHIIVNQADFRMRVVDDGRVVHSARVVVGKSSRHQTPEFSDEMTHMVVNPTWHVPRSIATKEILPKIKEDPTYLVRNNMRLVPKGGADEPLPIDFSVYDTGNFPFRIKQAPGDANSLGRVKFMFPNDFNIYLHDTPSKNLFGKDARAFSHGCVRVENPFDLAHLLLSAQESDPAGRFSRYLDAEREIYVNLDHPVPVHLTYRTAWVGDDGRTHFRADVYGRDGRVYEALRQAGLQEP